MNGVHRPQRYERTDPWKHRQWKHEQPPSVTVIEVLACIVLAVSVMILMST